MRIDEAAPQGAAQTEQLQLVRHWEHTYNTDVERLVLECYAPDAHLCFNSAEVHGHEQLMRVCKGVFGACPTRRMRVDHVHFSGNDTVILEAAILDLAQPEFYSPFCTLLTIRGGRIVKDRTYLEPTRWPGLPARSATSARADSGGANSRAQPA